jgi:hypothetical protein
MDNRDLWRGAEGEDPWRFKAVIEGKLVHISATFCLANIETFRAKLLALGEVLDNPDPTPSITPESKNDQ